MSIRLVVLDIAGTTLQDDNNVGDALIAAFAPEGITIDRAAANAVMGYPKPVAIAMLLAQILGHPVAASDPQVQGIHARFLENIVHFYATSPTVREKPGATALFERLRQRGIAVYLDTGFDRPTTDVILDRLGWRSRVDGSITSDEVERGRPYPDTIQRAMRLAGVDDPQAVAKVGDTPADLEGAKAAGCGLAIAVTTGATPVEELLRAPHTHAIAALAELDAILW